MDEAKKLSLIREFMGVHLVRERALEIILRVNRKVMLHKLEKLKSKLGEEK